VAQLLLLLLACFENRRNSYPLSFQSEKLQVVSCTFFEINYHRSKVLDRTLPFLASLLSLLLTFPPINQIEEHLPKTYMGCKRSLAIRWHGSVILLHGNRYTFIFFLLVTFLNKVIENLIHLRLLPGTHLFRWLMLIIKSTQKFSSSVSYIKNPDTLNNIVSHSLRIPHWMRFLNLGCVSLEVYGWVWVEDGFSVTECSWGSMELSDEEELGLRYQVDGFVRS